MPPMLLDGDKIIFDSFFGPATIMSPTMGAVAGSGHATASGRATCIEADVLEVEVKVTYISGAFTIPGQATLCVDRMLPDQLTQVATTDGDAIVLVSGRLTSMMKIDSPAKMPPPAGTPDPVPQYPGFADFQPTGPAPSAI